MLDRDKTFIRLCMKVGLFSALNEKARQRGTCMRLNRQAIRHQGMDLLTQKVPQT